MQTRHLLHASAFCLLASALCPPAHAQRVAQPEIEQPASAVTPPTDEDLVEMSPFIVNESSDSGYTPGNTTSGSRLNTALRDTAAAIQPFTKEFLDDIGATSLEDILGYAGNVEAEFEDNAGFNDSASRWASTTDVRFRLRGMTAAVLRNYTKSSIPNDLYNVDRLEIASGPNSILYGMGDPGGTVLYYSNRANVRRNTLAIKNSVGTWDEFETFPAERLVVNWNVVLLPKTLAFRLDGLYQNNNGYRLYTFKDQKRITPALTYKPFKNTTISINYERGFHDGNTELNWNAYDSITGWLAARDASQPLTISNTLTPGSAGSPTPPAYITLINTNNGTDHYVFNETAGTVANYRQCYVSTNDQGFTGNNGTTILVDPAIFPYTINPLGPGSQRNQSFQSWSAFIEQRVGIFDFELAYVHNDNKVRTLTASGADGRSSGLAADPNIYIGQAGSFAGSFNSVPKILNPSAGGIYMEEQWFRNNYREINDMIHLTAATELKLGRLGRLRLSALVERTKNDQNFIQQNEIWVDQNNVAINTSYSSIDANGNWAATSGLTPEGDQNSVWRRTYITEGDLKTYYSGDGRTPAPAFSAGDRTFHAAFVNRQGANYHNLQYTTSYAFATQGYWFKNKLVTLLGARLDNIKFIDACQSSSQPSQSDLNNPANPLYTTRILNMNDPRVRSGQNVFGEVVFSGYNAPMYYHPRTYTAGVVYHLTNRLSAFFNYSDNVGPPYFALNVLPEGRPGPPPKGRTLEGGVLIDPFADGKYTLRIACFDTRQLGDASIKPGSINAVDASALGSNDLTTIYEALRTFGAISDEQYYKENISYNGALADIVSKGWEINFSANPTKNLTMRLAFSYTDRQRTNMCPEIYDYYSRKGPEWLALASQLANPDDRMMLTNIIQGSLGNVYGKMVNNTWWENYTTNEDGILTGHASASSPQGSRKYKANFRVNYKFPGNLFKGFAVGGGVRYQSGPRIPVPGTGGREQYEGASLLFCDANLTYKRKIFMGKAGLVVQLNVKNIFNSDTVTQGRLAGYEDEDLHRVYLNPPRQIQLTTTFNF